jgi:hypothetical protein
MENGTKNEKLNTTPINKETIDPSITNEMIHLLETLLQKHGIKEVASRFNISTGTITRWIELQNIPYQYDFEILKMMNRKIDYTKYTSKQKDQFYTHISTAKICYEIFRNELQKQGENENDYIYIEPSSGEGSFLEVLPPSTISMDIEPKHPNSIEQDYLEWFPSIIDPPQKYVVFGNPPFGLRGHMALQFINHSYDFADYVGFILPQLFESDGKGVPRKRVKGFHLLYSTKLENTHFYEPNKKEVKINTIFQIWAKHHTNISYDIKHYDTDKMKIYSISNGGTVSTTRNKDMIGRCDVYIPSTCFGKENMRCYKTYDELPGKKGYGIVFFVEEEKEKMITKMENIDWKEIAFLSTNSAYNLRSSQIYELLLFH